MTRDLLRRSTACSTTACYNELMTTGKNLLTTYSNVVLHIPHASLVLPDDFWHDVTIEREKVESQLVFMSDYRVDELVRGLDYTKVVARYSRLYCDVERFRNDADEPMATKGMGAIYTHLPGDVRYREITAGRREEILKNVYDSYHAQFDEASQNIVRHAGSCLIIDLHSYSNQLVNAIFGPTEQRPDICLGYDDDWFDADDIAELKTFIESLGYSCAINHPYAGAMVPNWAYRTKDPRIRSVMLEINKRVYLDGSIVRVSAKQNVSRLIDEIQRVVFGVW